MDFLGEADGPTLAGLYDAADVFVLPSWFEGYGMVVTEALAHGLPVVTTTGGSLGQIVPEGVCERVEPGDVEALTAALEGLLRSPGARERLASAARRHARGLPTWADQARALEEALEA